jgi:hypothetical protein
MASLTTRDDLSHWMGQDIGLSPTGDVGRVNGSDRSRQRVLRRLLTNPGEYLTHPAYGAGLARFVGSVTDVGAITAAIRGQMLLESSVAKTPAPKINVNPLPNGLAVTIAYTSLPDKQPVALSFDVNA